MMFLTIDMYFKLFHYTPVGQVNISIILSLRKCIVHENEKIIGDDEVG